MHSGPGKVVKIPIQKRGGMEDLAREILRPQNPKDHWVPGVRKIIQISPDTLVVACNANMSADFVVLGQQKEKDLQTALSVVKSLLEKGSVVVSDHRVRSGCMPTVLQLFKMPPAKKKGGTRPHGRILRPRKKDHGRPRK